MMSASGRRTPLPDLEKNADVLTMLRQSPPDIHQWLLTVHSSKSLIQCHLNRERTEDFVTYTFVVDSLSMPVMLVRKRAKNAGHADLTLPGDRRVENPLYVLRRNRNGTEFALRYADKTAGDIVAVEYKLSDSDDVPRHLTILMPTEETRESNQLVNLLKSYHGKKEMNKFDVLRNKDPVWREDIKANVLNFGGRVKMASMKNFQVASKDDVTEITLQFGRVTRESFILDFKAPFCPLQALAIALSSFN